jgi:hypothetical protein
MKIFVSWSGPRSLIVARKLKDWLPLVLQGCHPWLSSEDIRKGSRWQAEMAEALRDPGAGVLCLTSDNLREPWIMFEAGAVSKAVTGDGYVCTYLVDVENADVPLPLGMFQSTAATREDSLRLVRNLNAILTPAVPDERLQKLFDSFWPELESAVGDARAAETPTLPQRDEHELLKEVLQVVRGLARSVTELRPAGDPLEDAIVKYLTRPGSDYYDAVLQLDDAGRRKVARNVVKNLFGSLDLDDRAKGGPEEA